MENNLSEQEIFIKELSEEIKEKFILFFIEIINTKLFALKYFNQNNITKEQLKKIIQVIINKNSVKSYKGELSTNSLIKYYHYIFISNIEDKENEEFKKIKNDFITLFEKKFEEYLNINNNNKSVNKYEINNHYINIYLKDNKLLLNKIEEENNNKNIEKDSFTFNSIGTLISCFPEKFSSPRQGNLLDLTRGKIILKKNIDIHSFDGIENFTYIWVVYVFNINQ